jgi:hypothetical protein
MGNPRILNYTGNFWEKIKLAKISKGLRQDNEVRSQGSDSHSQLESA